MSKQDKNMHYPKDVVTFDLFKGTWRTTATLCGVRRVLYFVTSTPWRLTCLECAEAAHKLWSEQYELGLGLMRHANVGEITGDVAYDTETLKPQLQTALHCALENMTQLAERIAEMTKAKA